VTVVTAWVGGAGVGVIVAIWADGAGAIVVATWTGGAGVGVIVAIWAGGVGIEAVADGTWLTGGRVTGGAGWVTGVCDASCVAVSCAGGLCDSRACAT
jgi:hypothetical protein